MLVVFELRFHLQKYYTQNLNKNVYKKDKKPFPFPYREFSLPSIFHSFFLTVNILHSCRNLKIQNFISIPKFLNLIYFLFVFDSSLIFLLISLFLFSIRLTPFLSSIHLFSPTSL